MSELSFHGVEQFEVAPERLFAALTDLDFIAATMPDLTQAEKIDERTMKCVVRPGFSFLRGTLHVTLSCADLKPPDSATMNIAAQGIGTRIRIASHLQIETTDSGARLVWNAAVTELGGLVATISKPLIQAAAEQTIQRSWQAIRTRLSELPAQ